MSLKKLGSKQNHGLEHHQPVVWVCFNQCFELAQHPAWLSSGPYRVPQKFIYAHRQQPGVSTITKCWGFLENFCGLRIAFEYRKGPNEQRCSESRQKQWTDTTEQRFHLITTSSPRSVVYSFLTFRAAPILKHQLSRILAVPQSIYSGHHHRSSGNH